MVAGSLRSDLMYTTEMQKTAQIASTEDPEKIAAFEARVAADEFVEPKEWMPEAYRRTLIRPPRRSAPAASR
jgi:ring-1,2-phenylacetyl-CoA epoxidase subunit PaaA